MHKLKKELRLTDDTYVSLMRDSIKRIKKFAHSGSKKFYKDQLTQDAICYQLSFLGEAASRVSARTRKVLGDVPWNQIIQNRRLALHPSTPASVRHVWKSATELVPQLRNALDLYGSEST